MRGRHMKAWFLLLRARARPQGGLPSIALFVQPSRQPNPERQGPPLPHMRSGLVKAEDTATGAARNSTTTGCSTPTSLGFVS
jgi:hypothetical protein